MFVPYSICVNHLSYISPLKLRNEMFSIYILFESIPAHTLSIGVATVEMYYDISVAPLITMRSTFAFATSQLAKAKVFLYQYERY